MGETWQIRIEGLPKLGSSRRNVVEKRMNTEWVSDLYDAMRADPRRTGGRPVKARVHIRVQKPRGEPEGDIDNYVKEIFDRLQEPKPGFKGVLENDKQVVELHATKRDVVGDSFVRIRLDWD